MNNYKQIIHGYVQSHRNEIVQELSELVKIPSVRGEAAPKAPFGEQCVEALKHTQKLYAINGFDTELYEEDGYLLSLYGKGEKSIGLFAHADVVPVSDDWLYTAPFEAIEKEGFLIGRGVCDNKAGVIISLYCAKCLKELGIPFHSRLILFTGSNEESGMQDIQKYIRNHKAPTFSFVPDTAFPLYRGDKGILRFYAVSDQKLQGVLDFRGGNAFNVVLGQAEAKLSYSDELWKELSEISDDRIFMKKTEQEILLIANGISRHAALPEGSLNAGFILADTLSRCKNLSNADRIQFGTVAKMLESSYGEFFGIQNTDSEFGRLTCANGIIKVESGKVILSFDIRYGAQVNERELIEKIEFVLKNMGWEYIPQSCSPAFAIPADNRFVTALLKVYSKFTGDASPAAHINAGGTYARYLPAAVETGSQIWKTCPFKMPAGHGGAHQPDECISIDGLLEAIELTMLMVLECDKELTL